MSGWAFVSKDSGIDATYIWRVVNSEKCEVSREAIIILSVALAADDERVDHLIDIANDLLDAGSYKILRAR